MAVLVGIDEAGYGPILGPLVVSAAVFQLPDDLLKQDLWKILNDSTAQQKRQLKGRLLITDSKKAYNRKSGLGHLERTSLACLHHLEKRPLTVHDLINILSPSTASRLNDYPWYSSVVANLLEYDDKDISLAKAVLSRDLKKKSVQLVDISSQCLDVGYYNRMVDAVRNKAAVLFTAVCTHIQDAFNKYGSDNLQIIVDRQGGRDNYVPTLSKMFPDHQITVLRQDKEDCSYELTNNGKKMRIHFVVKADARFMPVALASMVSKYLREIMVDQINSHFAQLAPQIQPTAGYWQDGQRFLEDIKKHLPNMPLDETIFVRSR